MPLTDPLGIVGTVVADKYDVQQVVGEGATAVVYRATHLVWKRPVALKTFRSMGELSDERRTALLDKLVDEARLLAELSERTAAIVQARDVGTFTTGRGEWVPYMVLEWLDGETLETRLHRAQREGEPPLDWTVAMDLLEPVAEALAFAHGKGIAHRDVKPSNVFLVGSVGAADPVVKLLDFGIAKVLSEAQKSAGGFQRTTGQSITFTPAYGAPEQFVRSYGATGPWTDVFALALVLVELATGRRPLDGDDFGQLAVCAAHPTDRPTLRRFGIPVSDGVEAVFAKAVAIKPDDRYRSVGEFWNALRAVRDIVPMADWVAPAPPAPPAPGHDERTKTLASRNAPAPVVSGATVGVGIVGSAIVLAILAVVANRAIRTTTPVTQTSLAPSPVVASPSSAAGAVAVPAPEPTCPAGMVTIPGGKFFMGSDDKADLALERPAHKVTLSSFCMDTYEVTANDYAACAAKGACSGERETNAWEGISPHERTAFDPLCNARDLRERGTHPINCVAWDQAVAFCEASGKRLPTEAEWEFAARGPDGRKFPWGDEAPSPNLLNACGRECVAWGQHHGIDEEAMYQAADDFETTAPVGSFPKGASRYGVQDVVGNVWEWVSDWYSPYAPELATTESHDPPGPETGTERVIRGGAWNGAYPAWVRPTFRYKDAPTKRSYGIGFRCASSLGGGTRGDGGGALPSR